MRRRVSAAVLLIVIATTLAHGRTPAPAEGTPSAAQTPASSPPSAQAPAADLKLPDNCRSESMTKSGAPADADHPDTQQLIYLGDARCYLPDNGRVDADSIAVSSQPDGTRIVAEGNVVFSGPDGHINAERLEYNEATGTGVFTVAH